MSLVIGAIALLAMLLPGGQAIGDGQDALFIGPNGNVGIGTNQPRAKLDVQGTVNAVKFTGDGSDLKVANATLAALRMALDMLVPIGTITAYGGDLRKPEIIQQLHDEGWLVCNGDPVKRNEYPELFNTIGVSFGAGDSKTTFHLPDMRGRFLRGVDQGKGVDPDAASRLAAAPGGNTGDAVGSVQEDAYQKHGHPLEKTVYKHYRSFKGESGKQHTLIHNQGQEWIKNTQAVGGQETRPRNIYVHWIIKARHVLAE